MFISPITDIKFLYEESYYNEQKLKEILKLDMINDVLKKMIKEGILKKSENKQISYKIQYVGVFIMEIDNRYLTIISLPKYLKKLNSSYHEQLEHTRTIIKLLQRYSSEKLTKEEFYTLGHDFDSNIYNFISTMEFILNDFADYGLYNNENTNFKTNDCGEINWNKTIEEKTPYYSKGNIFYLDYLSMKSEFDEKDYIRTLHKYILNKCSNFIQSFKIFDVFNYPNIEFDIDFSLLGGTDFILKSIQSEMQVQFSERKLNLLKAMYAFINNNRQSANNRVLLYGIKTFHNIWEKACSFVLKNEYDLFQKYIPRPIWKAKNMNYENKKDTLIPDILRVINQKLYIFDAKYYEINFNHNGIIIGNPPGISDIIKQYSYDIAFNNLFKIRHNSFIMPSTDLQIKLIGTVNLECFGQFNNINILHFPAEEIFEKYIQEKTLNIKTIQKIVQLLENQNY